MIRPDRIFDHARELAVIPHAPYLYRPTVHHLVALLNDLGMQPRSAPSADPEFGVYAIDDYALYVHIRRGRAARPLIVDTHLDHPAFVLDGTGSGVALGSLGLSRLQDLTARAPVPIRVFAPSGELIGTRQIIRLDRAQRPIITLAPDAPVPADSHGLWDVTDFSLDETWLQMHSADNIIATGVQLASLEAVTNDPTRYADIDIIYIFTFLEEIFEVSASMIACRKRTPFGEITPNHLIVVLEAMEVIPLAYRRSSSTNDHFSVADLRQMRIDDETWVLGLREESDLLQSLRESYDALQLHLPHPDNGLMLKVNDLDCAYGYLFGTENNDAESLALEAVHRLRLVHQHTLFGGACNGTAFSHFPTSSHIITLAIPNPAKHNIGADGAVIPERVRVRDVVAMAHTLDHMIGAASHMVIPPAAPTLTGRLRRDILPLTPGIARQLRAERGSIAWSARWRLRHGRFFGADSFQQLSFLARGGVARGVEQLWRRFG